MSSFLFLSTFHLTNNNRLLKRLSNKVLIFESMRGSIYPRKFMKKILFALSGVMIVVLVACSAAAAVKETSDKEKAVLNITKEFTAQTHYNKQDLNDEFSKKAFECFLDNIDPNKRFLLKKDVESLEKYKFKIDDALKTQDVSLFNLYNDLIVEREAKVEKMVFKILKQPIDLSTKDSIELDPDKIDFAEDEKELKARWTGYIDSRVVNEMYYEQKKIEESDTLPAKSLTVLEEEAREKVKSRIEDWFKRIAQQERADRFSNYVNSILEVYGPHTGFFPPKDKEDFDINMSGKLEGIGATLTTKDGYIKVSKIIAGSASWKQGDLEAGDLITAVAQGDSTPVDVVNMRLDKAVQLIRGPKGSEVRLTVKKVDGTSVIIPIIRDVVVIEETYAKSLLLKQQADSLNYGYIHLGSFYAEFGKANGKRCSEDVLQQIKALQASNVEGLILDLRNNGGGSLGDAVDMVGYFIENGPVVQVDGSGGIPQSYDDEDPKIQFDKPLVVMVNYFSASASEIFAAAIQDYNRGVIIGTNTFGKGTVQRFYPLNQVAKQYRIPAPNEDLGATKQTIAKFFRINGGATQLKGVKPDILLPDAYDEIEIGEKEYDYALPWTSIRPANYTPIKQSIPLDQLTSSAQKRIDTSSYFQSVKKNALMVKETRNDTKIPLNFEEYKAYKESRKKISDGAKIKEVKILDMTAQFNKLDLFTAQSDTVLQTRLQKFKEDVEKDHYIRESLRVLSQMVSE